MTTKIEWTDETWNPVTGCTKVSQGCKNCYAERVFPRVYGGDDVVMEGGDARARKFTDVWMYPDRLDAPLHWKKPRRVFVNSMSDLFHEDIPEEFIDRVFAVMALCPQHVFQILSKRPEKMRKYVNEPKTPFRVASAMAAITRQPDGPEEILPIIGFPGYFVSSHGHVYSERRGKRKKLKPDAGEQGHLRVPLFREGGPSRGERMLVHRIVLTAFDGPAQSDEEQGRHLDGNPANNAIGNLAWGKQSANWDDSKRHGSFRRYSKLTDEQVAEIRARGANGESGYSIARDFPVSDTQVRNILMGKQWAITSPMEWPLRNVWKGVSVEDQQTADERIPLLLQTPAAVRWISAEPLLSAIDLTQIKRSDGWAIDALRGVYSRHHDEGINHPAALEEYGGGPRLDWLVCGGESGPRARPCKIMWIESIRDACSSASVACFIKQLGEDPRWSGAQSSPIEPSRGKNSDPSEWPKDLRIRQFPR